MQPILKFPGSKVRLAQLIVSCMPRHKVYLEPYFGSGAVLFAKPPSRVETVNDLDSNVVNLFKMIRERPEELARLVEFTPWARDEYLESYNPTGDPLEDARRFLVRCWQAYSTRTGYKTGWRNSGCGTCSNMPDKWSNLPEIILKVAERLKHVQIENTDAIKLIAKHNHESVLIYADPPYMPGTKGEKIYACEMDENEHERLLDVLLAHKGPVILSGYENRLYSTKLAGWNTKSKIIVTEKGQSKKEIIWFNFKTTNLFAIQNEEGMY